MKKEKNVINLCVSNSIKQCNLIYSLFSSISARRNGNSFILIPFFSGTDSKRMYLKEGHVNTRKPGNLSHNNKKPLYTCFFTKKKNIKELLGAAWN